MLEPPPNPVVLAPIQPLPKHVPGAIRPVGRLPALQFIDAAGELVGIVGWQAGARRPGRFYVTRQHGGARLTRLLQVVVAHETGWAGSAGAAGWAGASGASTGA